MCCPRSRWVRGQGHNVSPWRREKESDRALYNLTLGGIQIGWMSEMSVPMTSASGNSSVKSLSACQFIYLFFSPPFRRQRNSVGFPHDPDPCNRPIVSVVSSFLSGMATRGRTTQGCGGH